MDKQRDKRWAKAVLEKYNGNCVHCGREGCAAHIIPRGVLSTRWILENGICFCEKIHKIWDEKSIVDKKRREVQRIYIGEELLANLITIKNKVNSIEKFEYKEIK